MTTHDALLPTVVMQRKAVVYVPPRGKRRRVADAAAKLGVSHHQVRKLIKAGILNSSR